MAYVSNQLNQLVQAPLSGESDGNTGSPNGGLNGGSLWSYFTGADAQAVVNAANYFSDALNKGLCIGDKILYTAADKSWLATVTAVALTGATLSVGVQI